MVFKARLRRVAQFIKMFSGKKSQTALAAVNRFQQRRAGQAKNIFWIVVDAVFVMTFFISRVI